MKLGSIALAGVFAVLLTACAEQNNAPTTRTDEQPEPLTRMHDVPTADDPYANDPIVSTTPAPAQDTTYSVDRGTRTMPQPAAQPAPRATAQRTHVVQRGDTLYSLARRYYNDQTRWRTIWEANQGTLRNKDQLPVGTRLVIP